MNDFLRKFVFRLALMALVLTCLGYGLFYYFFPESYFPFFPVIPAFLFLVTIVVHYYLVKASRGDSRKFTVRYMGSLGLKILVYICFIIVFLVVDFSSAIPFLVSFLVMYGAFTLFEVISILNAFKKSA